MAEDKRTLWSDLKKNIFDVGLSGDVTQGDPRRLRKKRNQNRIKRARISFLRLDLKRKRKRI